MGSFVLGAPGRNHVHRELGSSFQVEKQCGSTLVAIAGKISVLTLLGFCSMFQDQNLDYSCSLLSDEENSISKLWNEYILIKKVAGSSKVASLSCRR